MGKTIRLKPQVKPTFKYNINRQMGLLPNTIKVKNVIEHLDKCGISRNEFYLDRDIPFGSTKSIPHDRLMIYAQVFDCTIDDLTNHEIKAKSIREVMDDKPERSRKVKTSLR